MKDFNERTYGAATYGDRIVEVYDRIYPQAEEAAIDLLAELSNGGLALELGIGTGRVALPLSHRGVKVSGLDASEAMLAKLRAKEGGAEIETHLGDFSDFDLGKTFKLIYVPFNTIFAPLTQEAQIGCFRSVARHLAEGGRFLIEAFVPDLSRFDLGQRVVLVDMDDQNVRLDVTQHDALNQQITTQHVFLSETGIRRYPVKLRYAWPAELDLMARIAGLRLEQRWASWSKEPFTAESGKHVSVYTLA